MAFGQHVGAPATSHQLEELLALLRAAGHDGFRDARGPLGFTQRQAAGKFTRDEAQEYIGRLQQARDAGSTEPRSEPVPRLANVEVLLRRMPAEVLAAELQRRGWVVVEP
jgi:hypothetical protein